MYKFDLSDRFRLELRWGSAEYDSEGVCKLNDAYFCGPALSEANRLNEEDHIYIDFFHQYIMLVRNVYVTKLSWRGVVYENDGSIKLKNAVLEHATELNRVPKLEDTDYLIIDTSNHEVEKHQFNMLYKTFVVNADTQLYNFGGK